MLFYKKVVTYLRCVYIWSLSNFFQTKNLKILKPAHSKLNVQQQRCKAGLVLFYYSMYNKLTLTHHITNIDVRFHNVM